MLTEQHAEFDEKNAVNAVPVTITTAVMQVVVSGSEWNRQVTCEDADIELGKNNVKLEWEINSGWEVLGVHGLPSDVFSEKAKDGFNYKCKDKNEVVGDYFYTIIVGSTTTKEVAILDPTIRNRGAN
jgi:hypothetical protein